LKEIYKVWNQIEHKSKTMTKLKKLSQN